MWQYGANTIDREHIYKVLNANYDDRDNYAAIWTGEYRKPKIGEFYISGGPDWGYCFFAFGPVVEVIDEKCHIAKIYKVKKHEYWTLEEPV